MVNYFEAAQKTFQRSQQAMWCSVFSAFSLDAFKLEIFFFFNRKVSWPRGCSKPYSPMPELTPQYWKLHFWNSERVLLMLTFHKPANSGKIFYRICSSLCKRTSKIPIRKTFSSLKSFKYFHKIASYKIIFWFCSSLLFFELSCEIN